MKHHNLKSRILLLVGAAFVASACSHADMRKHYKTMRPNMMKGNWTGAAAQMSKAKKKVYGKKDRIMYWLNLATIQHYAGQTAQSQSHFEKAEDAMQDLWTKSITGSASKYISGETTQAYAGEDYENVLIYLYTSLNKAMQGNFQDAQVEARRAAQRLQKMKVFFETKGCPKKVDPKKCKAVYTQDAFMLWMVGLYREIEGGESLQDALIFYKDAYDTYASQYSKHFGSRPPSFLGEDIVRVAKALGRDDVVKEYGSKSGATGETLAKTAEMGEVILIHGNGESPFKTQMKFRARMPDGHMISMAIPKFNRVPHRIDHAKLTVGNHTVNTELAEPVTSIVLTNFKYRLPAIQARAIARTIIKYVATKVASAAAKKAGGGALGALVGLAGNVASEATEAADLRSWTLLPANFGVGRLWLPAGEHNLKVTYHSKSGGKIGRTDTIKVSVKPGRRTILSLRSMR